MSRSLVITVLFLISFAPILPPPAHAISADMVINEIGASENSDHEWVEIYNKGPEPVDMTGWKFFENDTNHGLNAYQGDMIIEPGEYAVIADVAINTASDYPAFTGTLIDSAWSTLNESGESIALKDNTGTIVEQFTYIPAAPTHSLERIDAIINDYTNTNWIEHSTSNTIGAVNDASTIPDESESTPPDDDVPPLDDDTPPPDEQDPPNDETPPPSNETPPPHNETPSTSPPTFSRGDLLINEFVSDPTDDDTEWIELYNPLIKNIDLAGWTIEDGSKGKTILAGAIGSNANTRFFVVENPKGKLNNPGDVIILKSPTGDIIDEVAYGNWADDNDQNNAPVAKDPFSVARVKDGANTYNNTFDFQITAHPTKGSSNVIIDPDSPTGGDTLPFIKNISITELLPNPIGPDTKGEFIELYNGGDSDIDLLNWEVINNAGRKYIVNAKKLTSTIIPAHHYFVLSRTVTGLALKNTGGDGIKLYQPNGEKPNAVFTYTEKAIQGQSYVLFNDGQTGWTTTPTPGGENIKTIANQPPDLDLQVPTTGTVLEEIPCDASDTIDPEQDPLTYTWDFGDGQKGEGIALSHHYDKAGRYKISLTVTDGTNKKITTKTITIKESIQNIAPSDTTDEIEIKDAPIPQESINIISSIVINEIFPNPKGKDTDEFIELVNTSDEPVDISRWRVAFQLGKKSYTYSTSTMIPANGYLLLTTAQEKIQLRNIADTVVLYDTHGNVIDTVFYETAPEAQSLNRTDNNDFVWSKMVTPGQENVIDLSVTLSNQQGTTSTSTTHATSTKNSTSSANTSSRLTVALDQIRDFPLNTSIVTEGVVASVPGVLGANIFYLAGSGVQVYVSKNQIPTLARGDTIKIAGVLSQISNEERLKVSQKSDITLISHGQPPTPHDITASQVNEEYEGSLVRLQGDVVKVQWPSIYIDDGDDEARIYVKASTGIPHIKIASGDIVQVTGVVSQTSSGYRILPRTTDDLVVSENTNITTSNTNTSTLSNTTLSLTGTNAPIPLTQIGVVSLFGIIFLASGVYIQRKTNTKK
ncbi:MAG: lamin tail domain-containing protein [bacterium]|nr:lamin tail domain-containing protein [bacterium]